MVAAALLLLPAAVWAQIETGFIMGETHIVDIRDFVYSEQQNQDNVVSRVMSRSTSDASPNILWIDRINNLPDCMRAFYDKYCSLVHEVLAGGSNCLSDPDNDKVNAVHYGISSHIPITHVTRKIEYTYPVDVVASNPYARFKYINEAVTKDIDEYVRPEFDSMAWIFIPYVHTCLSYDLPEAFWIGYQFSWSNYTDYRYNFLDEPGRDSVEYTYTMCYTLKMNDFDVRIDGFSTSKAISDGVSEYNGLIDTILAHVPQTTRYDQIRYLNNWLTTNNAYSSARTTGEYPLIARSPMSALRGCNDANGPVCEGYARAFKILCNRLGIPCVLAVGNAFSYIGEEPGTHMWNEVMMNDDKWYAVDVTWNDPITENAQDPKVSGRENEKWLLLGKNTVVSTFNGRLTFAESHPNSIINGVNQSAYWDYSNESFITDSKFDPATGIDRISNAQDNVIYSILGVKLDMEIGQLEPGLYIINGRKVVIM